MKRLDPQTDCPCGSGRLGGECCVVEIAPVAGLAIGFDSIRMSVEGLHVARQGIGRYVGRPGLLPPNLSVTSTLKNPHQMDADVEAIMDLLAALLEGCGSRFDRDAAGKVWHSLEDNLYATRYHQRQYLFRHRIVHERTLSSTMAGSKQIELIFSDVPLKTELEAVVVRSRSTLDAVGAIGLGCLNKSGDKFGAFRSHAMSAACSGERGERLRRIFTKHEKWLEEGRELRNVITHGGHVHNFRGVKSGVAGIDPARLERDDAAEYVLSMWSILTGFVLAVFNGLR